MSEATSPPTPDVVSIVVGRQVLSGWETVRVTRSMEYFPSSFEIELTEKYPTSAGEIVLTPGDPCAVMLGSDTVLTGYVEEYTASVAAQEHTVRIAGRSTCLDLLDCSGGESPYQTNNTTLVALAKQLAQPFGVTVSAPDGDSAAIPQISVTLTEPPYEILERIARWAAFVIYDDTTGNLVIAKVGDAKAASGFSQGQNVQAMSVTFSTTQRYTEIRAVYLSTDFLNDGGPPPAGSHGPVIASNTAALAKDTSFPRRKDGQARYRPLIIVSPQTQNIPKLAQQHAEWDMARRVGRSQAVHLTCDSWRDSAGALWAPNTMAPLDLPSLKLTNVTWIIATVTFLRDANGTTAELVLMPRSAFVPEPENLLPFDNNVAKELPNGSSNIGPAAR